jgi:hypothetical protein
MHFVSSSRITLVAVAVLCAGVAGCKKKPTELAPVKAGDTFTYKIATYDGRSETQYDATFTLKPGSGADTLTLEAEPTGNQEPLTVDLALDPGKRIKTHYLGQLWLPPAHRVVGAKSLAGQVAKQVAWQKWQVWEVEEFSGGKGGRWFFDTNTGFLVGSVVPVGQGTQNTFLVRSSIAGL